MSEVAVGASVPSPVTATLLSPPITSAAVILPFPFASLVSILFLLAAAAPSARAGRALPKTTGVKWSTNAPIASSSVGPSDTTRHFGSRPWFRWFLFLVFVLFMRLKPRSEVAFCNAISTRTLPTFVISV